ncbi:MAG: hypothetical protein OEY20_13790, partial [Gemmatimonadota bacterium]|nr:hypothetical protein [Gemmatimonadota bacterium]
MAHLLKNLLGNGSRDQEMTDEMRAVLQEITQERSHCEVLVKSARTSLTRVGEMSAPIAKAQSDTDAMTARLEGLEQRLSGVERLTALLETLDERGERLGQSQRQAEARITHAADDVQRVRSQIEELSHKVDLALELKERLGTFLEVDAPFRQLQGDADALRGQVAGAGEQLARMREQHDRMMDTHKAGLSKMDAFERQHEDLTRGLQDKERRLALMEQTLRGMDDVGRAVEDAKHKLGTLKALGDYVAQKTAALQAQRDAVEQAAARAEHLDHTMRRIDAGVRQQEENTKTLAALQEDLASLQALHDGVIRRSQEVDRIQSESDEQLRVVRTELGAARDEVRKTVERFDFENRGLEAVNQRVSDLRSVLADFEARFNGLSESGEVVAELASQTQGLTAQIQTISQEVGRLDEETRKVQAIRRDLDETGALARSAGERIARVEETRPSVEAALRDVEQLRGTHALVKDALEQTRIAAADVARVRESQSETRTWLAEVEQSLATLEGRTDELRKMTP